MLRSIWSAQEIRNIYNMYRLTLHCCSYHTWLPFQPSAPVLQHPMNAQVSIAYAPKCILWVYVCAIIIHGCQHNSTLINMLAVRMHIHVHTYMYLPTDEVSWLSAQLFSSQFMTDCVKIGVSGGTSSTCAVVEGPGGRVFGVGSG